ncbi:DoxX family protein [Streptomyces sp. 7N604]|uniref:DoxX family protein n=1 Tax=Streptomyces sp. 7N604 TaxID=3457415 RepID=UPI003FD482D5
MFVATVLVSLVLAALLTYSATRKLSHEERVVQTYTRVGVQEDKLNYLAIILLAGAGGLLLGLIWAPIGIAAAIGLILYFITACTFHIRAKDTKNLPAPLVIALLALVALILRLATA